MGAGDTRVALWKAARAGDEQLVAALLTKTPRECAELLRWENSAHHGYTALHIACQKGHFAVAKSLVEAGANVRAQARGGTTPLHEATYERHELLALFLLKQGAKLDVKTDQGASPLDLAARKRFATDLQTMYLDSLQDEEDKSELRRALASSILDNNFSNIGISRCRRDAQEDECERQELAARIEHLEETVAQRDETIANLLRDIAAEQSRAADLECLVQEANARRRRAEHDLGDAGFEIDGLREQVREAERYLKETTHENAHLDKLIQTSVQAVRKRQRGKKAQERRERLAQTALQSGIVQEPRSPRTTRLRTLESRLKDAEHQAFVAHEARLKAERAAYSSEMALQRAQRTLTQSTPFLVRQLAEDMSRQWLTAGVRRVSRFRLLQELKTVN
ncbi:Ankyrin repeat domain-containing protein 1 [Hondaea fermentalgiana]|uniref:Ankyrin repeat domain-containing protein 1 n=1 Tax=Hondaea fermentalgiana TaxID=2315210 RepID=A0A2R5G4M5_9STRA|nr:Ankyrin repeat domain-containing protein 1 [Hondaea fermentalgiana]|eukprot:GBG25269.1 Ankyrin repeat domain-containing protein 1 [Hondaea fermentalgiana]